MSEPATLRLGFWGVGVQVCHVHPQDMNHLGYYFRDHRVDAAAHVRVRLSTGDGSSFLASLTDHRVEKRVFVDTGDGWRLYERFNLRAQLPTVLPPFTMPPLSSLIRIAHGSVAVPPNGGPAVVIRGASMAGKSSLLLALLCRGWAFLADDIVVSAADGTVQPYGRPLGIRAATLSMFPSLESVVRERAIPIMTASGWTYMVHPADLGLQACRTPVRPGLRIDLRRSDSLSVDDETAVLRVGYRPDRHLATVAGVIEDAAANGPR
jgi:hypothetical protein